MAILVLVEVVYLFDAVHPTRVLLSLHPGPCICCNRGAPRARDEAGRTAGTQPASHTQFVSVEFVCLVSLKKKMATDAE